MFKPLNNRVLVKPDEKIKQTVSGILLPDSDEKSIMTGVVVVGNKEVKKGNRVIFSKFGYDEVKINDKVFYTVSDFNLLGIF